MSREGSKEWQLNENELKKTAELAALVLDSSEMEVLRQSLEKILEHFAVIEKIEPTTSIMGTPVEKHALLKDMRDDVSAEGKKKQIESNAPDFEDGFFFIPEIIK